VNGNSSTATANITVVDSVKPTAITQDLTVQLDTNGAVSITAAQVDNGSSDNCAIDTMVLDVTSFDCSNVGVNTVTLLVTDVNGNSSTTTANITVVDSVKPTAITQDMTVQLDTNGAVSITAAQVDNGSSDNCAIDTMVLDTTPFDCSNVGENTVTLTVTDVNGNSSTATANITVVDSVKPTAITQDMTVQLDANGAASITAAQLDNGSSDNCAIDTMVLDVTSFDCSNIGVNTVTLSITDVNGNSSTATANTTVVDSVKPTVVTQDLTVQLDANGSGSITATGVNNGSFDNCAIDTMVLDATSFDCSNVGENTVTLTVTDVNGNVTTNTATITVVDSVNPTVVAQNLTVQLDANGAGNITAAQLDNGSFDNCGIDTMVLDTTDFYCSSTGDNTVTLTVTDVNGNSSSATATVTVIDIIDPTVLTTNHTVTLSNGVANITASDIDNGTFDNCDFTLSIDRASFTCSDIGDHTVTLTATDDSGNTSSETATVTVIGDIPDISISDFTTVQTQNTNTIYLGFGDQSVNLSTTTTGGNSFTYQWTASTGEFVENTANPEISPTVSTTYTVIATNDYGCSTSTSIEVCVMEARSFNKKGNATGKVLVCHHTNGKKGTKHVLISISSNAVMKHLSNHGTGTDHADRLGECGATCITAITATRLSLNQETPVELLQEIKVYPNPSNGIFNIKLNSIKSRTEITLYDIAGKVVSREIVSSSTKSQNISVGNSVLPSGFYILKIISNEESIIKKLIVRK